MRKGRKQSPTTVDSDQMILFKLILALNFFTLFPCSLLLFYYFLLHFIIFTFIPFSFSFSLLSPYHLSITSTCLLTFSALFSLSLPLISAVSFPILVSAIPSFYRESTSIVGTTTYTYTHNHHLIRQQNKACHRSQKNRLLLSFLKA